MLNSDQLDKREVWDILREKVIDQELKLLTTPEEAFSIALGRSGSMSGEPLTEALCCVNHIVGRLQPTDQVAVVLYDDNVQRPVPVRAATNAAAATTSSTKGRDSAMAIVGWAHRAKVARR